LTSKDGPFSLLLDYRRYLVRNADPTYGWSKASQLRRRHRLLDGPFHGVSLLDGSDPLSILALLTRFRTAADEMDVTPGEAPYLLAYRIGGEAKDDFVQETNGPHGRAVCTCFPHTINYLLTRYAPEDALHTAKMAHRTEEQRQDEGERAFYQRLMRLGRRLMGMHDPGQLLYLFLKGLHPSVQAQAQLADRTCTTFDELVPLSHKIGDGLRAVKVTVGNADRYTEAKSVLQLRLRERDKGRTGPPGGAASDDAGSHAAPGPATLGPAATAAAVPGVYPYASSGPGTVLRDGNSTGSPVGCPDGTAGHGPSEPGAVSPLPRFWTLRPGVSLARPRYAPALATCGRAGTHWRWSPCVTP